MTTARKLQIHFRETLHMSRETLQIHSGKLCSRGTHCICPGKLCRSTQGNSALEELRGRVEGETADPLREPLQIIAKDQKIGPMQGATTGALV